MNRILLVADSQWVRNEIHAALTTPDFELIDSDDPHQAGRQAFELGVDAVIVDLQVASMGGMAITRDVRNHADLNWADLNRPDLDSADPDRGSPAAGVGHIPVVMLLDRAADGFLAKRAGAAGWVTKPLSGQAIAETIRTVTARSGADPDHDEPETGYGGGVEAELPVPG